MTYNVFGGTLSLTQSIWSADGFWGGAETTPALLQKNFDFLSRNGECDYMGALPPVKLLGAQAPCASVVYACVCRMIFFGLQILHDDRVIFWLDCNYYNSHFSFECRPVLAFLMESDAVIWLLTDHMVQSQLIYVHTLRRKIKTYIFAVVHKT